MRGNEDKLTLYRFVYFIEFLIDSGQVAMIEFLQEREEEEEEED